MKTRDGLLALVIVAMGAACSSEHAPASGLAGQAGAAAGAGSGGGGAAGVGGSAGEASAPRLRFFDAQAAEVSRLRYGEAFTVVVDGLEPHSEVTIRSAGQGYEGWATFDTGATGIAATDTHAPLSGTYEGVEPEGLVWSMQKQGEPVGFSLDLEFRVLVGQSEIASATLERAPLDEGLESELLNDGGLVGRWFKPESASGPLPGLIVVGGSEGGLESAAFGAAWFAGYGYVALGLAYFDAPGLPSELTEIPLEYFEQALSQLTARPDVDPTRIGVIGGSRGGELVLMLGEYFPNVRAVVAQVPSGVRWGSVDPTQGAAWTYQDEPLPYLGNTGIAQPVVEKLDNGEIGYRFTPMFEEEVALATPEQLDAATIRVEHTNGPVLMLAGEDDALWPSCQLSEIALARLEASGHAAKHADALLCFEGAGHVAPYPGSPTTDSYAHDMGAYWLILGGTPAANARAQRQGLTALASFLETHLK